MRYQIYHGLAFLILGLNADRFSFSLKSYYVLTLIGVVLFSGTLYLLALQESLTVSLTFLGPVTPLGGLLMIIGWSFLLFNILKKQQS